MVAYDVVCQEVVKLNYGEDLAYWYLRLNGFVPMTDYVLHEVPGLEQASDVDLLALRLPHVQEPVGGRGDEDWDGWFATTAGIELTERCIAVIGEVKTGTNVSRMEVETTFSPTRTVLSLRRLGLIRTDSDIPGNALHDKSFVIGQWTVLRIAFLEKPISASNCYTMSLQHANQFIRQRLKKHENPKFRDRFFFQDPLIEYLAWRIRRRFPAPDAG